jgi:lysophospholipase L1-like esterase
MGTRRLLATMMAAMVVAAVGAGCTSDRGQLTGSPLGGTDATAGSGAPVVAPTIETVGILGDSITVGSEAEIVDAVRDLGVAVVEVDAESGRRLVADSGVDSGVDAARRVTALDPDVWVVALGTNDVPNPEGAEEYSVVIDELLRQLPVDDRVVWVDVHVDDAAAASDAFNVALRDRLADRGRAVIVEWSAHADGAGMLRDGVHPTAAGGLVFADLVADGVAAWLE